MTGPFRPDELRDPAGSDDAAELASAFEAARLLERAVGADGVQPGPDFSARVMAAIAAQPAPRRSRLGLLAGTIRGAWRTASSAGQPPMIRARAIAIVLVVILAVGSFGGAASLAAAGALDLFGPHLSPSPLVTPGPTPSPPPTVSPSPSLRPPAGTPEPTEVESPGEPPEASETPEPAETPDPTGTDDHGGSGGGGGGGSATPRPSRTPHAAETPEPTETAEPTETSDH